MMSSLSPSIWFMVGGVVMAFVPRTLRRLLCLALPIVVMVQLMASLLHNAPRMFE